MSLERLISKEELLVGMPAKRTKTLLFLIEKQTALLAERSLVDFSLTDGGQGDRDQAFLQAFALDECQTLPPTIQQLERFASEWSILVPENPQLKAGLLRAFAEKYHFTESRVPNIRQVLGCEQMSVQQAYHKLYQQPLVTAFKSEISLLDRCHWLMFALAQRIESLPPFWLATLITVALGLPQAFLALPIAVAGLGSALAVILLIILGGINILTMICMAEAIGRSQDFRSGSTFIQQLAANYLGKSGSSILGVAVSIRVVSIAIAGYIGLSMTMANFTTLPATIWAGLLFLLGALFLYRQSLNLALGLIILLAFVNISLLLLFSLLCIDHWQLDNLLYVNWNVLERSSFEPQILHRVFGVTLMLYFGHVYVGECAKIVLPKDPSANSLLGGTIAGTTCLTLLFCLWVIAVDGAIAPEILVTQTGTVLEPIIAEIGSQGKVLGTILVTLLLGMAWLRSSNSLVNLSRALIPNQRQFILSLSRQQSRLILQTRDRYDSYSLGIDYLKFDDNKATFGLDLQLQGNIYRQEIEVSQSWSIKELFTQYPQLNRQGVDLSLEIQAANRDRVCLKVVSSMTISCQGNCQEIGLENTIARQDDAGQTSWNYVGKYLSQQRRFLFSILPLFLVFLLTEALLLTNRQSFTAVLGFAGILGNSLIGGIFPVLLLISSRRKGELLPGRVFELLNSRWLLGSIYSFSLLIILGHGLFIWENPVVRIAALLVTLFSLVATLVMLQTGAFVPCTVIEIVENGEATGQSLLKISTGGKPKITRVKLGYQEGERDYHAATIPISSRSSLKYAIFQLPTKQLEELKIWLHNSQSQNHFRHLPELIEIHQEQQKMRFNLKVFGDKALFPLNCEKCWCKLKFPAVKKTA
ncbi:MAG: hypothetical protein QNJ72_32195 [Pleurocapsa sp. MO_226.B13]|nr:hypothetical protein [Pleurocapsa sp. MO_226.B13]